MKIILFLFIIMSIPGAWASTESELEIAKKYAPVVYQGLGPDPRADEFTRVDFDGDFNPDNNWDNMPNFPRPRVVYWDVIESENFYFITYAFFFPRDYARWCFWIHCHENDFEGMRVTVRKPSQLVKVEALAHNFRSEELNPKSVEVSIEKEGHGVHPLSLRKPDEQFKKYTPEDYELRPLVELWKLKDTPLFTGKFEYNKKSYPANFGGKKWILFGFGAAKPPWSWEVWKSDIGKGEFFLDPLRGKERYIKHFDRPVELVEKSN